MIIGSCHVSGLLAFVPRLVQAPLLLAKGSMPATILLLCAGHALCDYPLQGEFLAQGKNRHTNPGSGWIKAMTAHCLIQSGMVYVVAGILFSSPWALWFAIAEFAIHFATDFAKCEGWINSDIDQAIHYACKILWGVL